ncbi:hypothetical protein L873DRAFT_201277 [Choiromyces venosus 120613-1]|uniref:Uncharacterized protein n=1 Tax=Choiromyces venosus 120613-1 TaxID=1336337 RepID=A0A3N4J1U1_9PEZI|nr:hypothetical protein L873DRAFT_201277 [Choiromyces venosus 120613-1]
MPPGLDFHAHLVAGLLLMPLVLLLLGFGMFLDVESGVDLLNFSRYGRQNQVLLPCDVPLPWEIRYLESYSTLQLSQNKRLIYSGVQG